MIRPAKHKNGQDVGMERMQELWEGWKLIDGEGKSFWGARLNPSKDKIMIRPAKHKNGQDVGMERMQELWEGWKLIDGEGKMGVK